MKCNLKVKPAMDEVVINVDMEEALALETMSYEIEQYCRNICRLMYKDISITNPVAAKHYEHLVARVIAYSDAKSAIGTKYVDPVVESTWGKGTPVAWTLSYKTAMLTITRNGKFNGDILPDIIQVEEDVVSNLKNHSVKSEAYDYVYDFMASSYPTTENAAYNEFCTDRDVNDSEFNKLKKELEKKYVEPTLLNMGYDINSGKLTYMWELNYASRQIEAKISN